MTKKGKVLSLVAIIPFFFLAGCNLDVAIVETPNLYIANKPNKITYNVGETFSLKGLKVIENKSGEEITEYTSSIAEDYKFIETDVSEKKPVYISATGYKKTSFDIKVVNLPYLYIQNLPQTEYEYKSFFSLEGLVVTDKDNNIITNYIVSPYHEGQVLDKSGTFEVEISVEGYYPVSYEIIVYNEKSLHVDTLPNKTSYEVGEAFSSEGLVIKDERGNVFTRYTLSIEENEIFKVAGTKTVTVNDKNEEYLSTSFEIEVKDKESYQLEDKDLKIYYVNDTHGSFTRTDEEAGISYIGQYIMSNVENNTKNGVASLVLSGGDMFQGGIESNETHGDIMIDAMNIIGFDAMALGNHEFDWGEEYLSKFQDKLDCPLLSCNTFYADGSEVPYLSKYTVVEKLGVKIGIIGAVEANIGSSITGSIANKFRFPDPTRYMQSISSDLRKEGCDIIIGIFHDGGFDGSEGEPTKYNSLTREDESTGRKYLDAMFFAHDHQMKKGVYNDVPFLETGSNGRNIGEMVLNLEGNGYSFTVKNSSVSVLNAFRNCTKPSDEIDALANKYSDVIGDPDEVICTFDKTYSREEFTVLMCQAMLWYVNEHPRYFDNVTVYFASHNTGGVRYYPIPEGEFTYRDLVKVMPFDNELCIQTCTQTNIINMMKSSYYETYSEGDIVYDSKGYTTAVTISYIAEYRYAYQYQKSMVKYDGYTAKMALKDYLLNSGEFD